MFCENCGNKLDDNAKICPSCGTRTDSTESTNKGEIQKNKARDIPMTHCDKCFKQVPLEGEPNCPYCGAEIHEPTGPKCPHCGTILQDNKRSCVVCGGDIPGKYDGKPLKSFLSLLAYKKPNGLLGISIFGWIVLTVLVLVIMGIYALIQTLIY